MHDRLMLDCTCLTHFARLKRLPFEKLGDLVKSHFLVPDRVVPEFTTFFENEGLSFPVISKILRAIDYGTKFKKCVDTYPIVLNELQNVPDIHLGEAEAMSARYLTVQNRL